MVIQGRIVEVMESWPVQLVVQTRDGRYHVELLSQASVERGNQKVDPGQLVPNMQVRVEGQSGSGQFTMTAQLVIVL